MNIQLDKLPIGQCHYLSKNEFVLRVIKLYKKAGFIVDIPTMQLAYLILYTFRI